MAIKKNLTRILLSAFITIGSSCSSAPKEGEVVWKEYRPERKGTPIFGFSAASLAASIILHFATQRPEMYLNRVESSDLENGVKYSTINNRLGFEATNIGDWLVYTNDQDMYESLRRFSNTIPFEAGKRIDLKK